MGGVRVVRLSKHKEGFDPLSAHLCVDCKLTRSVWSRPVVSHRGLRRRSYPQLLGAHAPASLCTRLFTSSRPSPVLSGGPGTLGSRSTSR